MPLTVFDCKGISATRRERIEAAVGGNPSGETRQPELSDFRDGAEVASGLVQRDPAWAGLVENSRSSG